MDSASPPSAAPEQPARLPRAFSPAHITYEVFDAELEEIIASREHRAIVGRENRDVAGDLKAERKRISEEADRDVCRRNGREVEAVIPRQCGLVGLALSGGGIRSASVCLGVLQALAEKKYLSFIDYLSTVSGGGYIGSSWSALLAKSEDRGAGLTPDFPFIHAPHDDRGDAPSEYKEEARRYCREEPAALYHVRDFANYLIPNGLADQLQVPVLILRGLIVNVLILAPYILLLAALTLLWVGAELKSAFEHRELVYPSFYLTLPWTALCLIVLLIVVPVQRYWRRADRSTWNTRRRALRLGTIPFLLLLGAVFIEVQPLAISYLSLHGRDVTGQLTDADFWGVLGTIGGLLSGLFAAQAAGASSTWKRRLALILFGILGPLALWLLYFYLCKLATTGSVTGVPIWIWASIYFGAGIVLYAWSWFGVDVNTTSLHNYYRDRLSAAFMIAGKLPQASQSVPAGLRRFRWRGRAEPGGEDGWWVQHVDEVSLSDLCPGKTGAPYHLINATLNSPDFARDGRPGNPGQRGRRADFFLFSPRYCGDEHLGYCATRALEAADPHLDLATAMAISAAAAAPSMGQKSFDPLTTFALAMLNVRLGYWLPRPERVAAKLPCRKTVGPIFFLLELIGIVPRWDWARSHVNVSDGGHIENLGIFELLRRRCRFIIAIDAEADPDMTFNGLAVVQRLAKVDLDVDIDFDIEDLRKEANGLSRQHFALCTIDYGPAPDGGRDRGELLYIKSSLLGTEIEYLKEYQSRHPAFPHDSTGDQFFDEAQFEAYRRLGYKMGSELVESRDARQHAEIFAPRPEPVSTAEEFFAEIRRWLRPAAPFRESFVNLQEQRRAIDLRLAEDGFARYRAELLEGLRLAGTDGAAGRTSAELADEAASFTHNGPEPARRTQRRPNGDGGAFPEPDPLADEARHLQLVNQQMQLIERAVLDLGLSERINQIHPRNRGWMNLFRAWSQSQTFQKYWALNIAYYSDVLQTFSYYALGLELGIEWRWQPKWEELSRAERRLIWHKLAPGERRPDLARQPQGLHPENVGLASVVPVERWSVGPISARSAEMPVALALLTGHTNGQRKLDALRVRDTYRCLGPHERLLVRLERELSAPINYNFDGDGTHIYRSTRGSPDTRLPSTSPPEA